MPTAESWRGRAQLVQGPREDVLPRKADVTVVMLRQMGKPSVVHIDLILHLKPLHKEHHGLFVVPVFFKESHSLLLPPFHHILGDRWAKLPFVFLFFCVGHCFGFYGLCNIEC